MKSKPTGRASALHPHCFYTHWLTLSKACVIIGTRCISVHAGERHTCKYRHIFTSPSLEDFRESSYAVSFIEYQYKFKSIYSLLNINLSHHSKRQVVSPCFEVSWKCTSPLGQSTH